MGLCVGTGGPTASVSSYFVFLLSVCLHFSRLLLGVAGLLLLQLNPALGQNTAGYGDWQLHLPTNHPLHVADAGDRVYVVAENAFYFLDKNLNTTQVLSSRDGLSDVGVTAVAYDSVSKQTVLAYKNANIDILQPNGSVRNLSDVLRKLRQGGIQGGDRIPSSKYPSAAEKPT